MVGILVIQFVNLIFDEFNILLWRVMQDSIIQDHSTSSQRPYKKNETRVHFYFKRYTITRGIQVCTIN